MKLDFIVIILLLASAQGFFLALIIFKKHGKLYANRFLGMLIVIYSLVVLNLFFSDIGYYEIFPLLIPVTTAFPLLLGPLHFLYVKYLTKNQQKVDKKDILHFIPFLVVFLYFIIAYHDQDQIRSALFYSKPENYPSIFMVFNWLLIIQAFIYIGLSLSIIKRYSRYYRDTFSSMEQVRLDWIRNITYLVASGLIIFTIENFFLQIGINLSNYFTISSIIVAVYIYTLGYSGFIKSEIFEDPEMANSLNQIPALKNDNYTNVNADVLSVGNKYEKSGLSSERAQEYLQQLKNLMKEKKPYTDSSLSLHQLAEQLQITPHNLSEVINTGLGENFFDFVNQYRVEKVKTDLADTSKYNLTLLSIGLDAGFNSKSSFNAIFKKHTGMTPSEFRDKKFGNK